MAKDRNTRIETPGEPETPALEETANDTADAPVSNSPQVNDQVAAAPANPEPVTDAEKKRELDRQIAIVAKGLKDGSKDALDWSQLTNHADLAGKVNTYVDPDKDLPNPDDVDWSKVKGDRILTKQGWLLKA